MQAGAADAQRAYSEALGAVLNGAVRQLDMDDELEAFGEKYNLLSAVMGGYGQFQANSYDWLHNGGMEALQQQLREAGVEFGNLASEGGFRGVANALYEALAKDMEEIAGNGELGALLASALQGGMLDNADASAFTGPFLALLQVMDVKQIADKGAKEWKDIAKESMGGLSLGFDESSGEPITKSEAVAQGLIDAARRVLDSHSPSREFEKIGMDIDAGLAQGIYDNAGQAIEAAEWLAREVSNAMNAVLDIHSPSRVAQLTGQYVAEGLAVGMEGNLGRVERAVDRLSGVVGRAGRGTSAAEGTPVRVSVQLDKKTLVDALVPAVDEAIGAML